MKWNKSKWFGFYNFGVFLEESKFIVLPYCLTHCWMDFSVVACMHWRFKRAREKERSNIFRESKSRSHKHVWRFSADILQLCAGKRWALSVILSYEESEREIWVSRAPQKKIYCLDTYCFWFFYLLLFFILSSKHFEVELTLTIVLCATHVCSNLWHTQNKIVCDWFDWKFLVRIIWFHSNKRNEERKKKWTQCKSKR